MNITPITDFFSNIKNKISNPFFGTLIFVWLVRNWDLVYSIMNFDKGTTLTEKTTFIQEYINKNYSIKEILVNIAITIILIIIGYLLIVLTRSISTWFEFRIMPFLTQKIISDKVVFRDDYEKVKSERDEYSESYEEQRARVRTLSKQFDELSGNYKVQSDRIVEYSDKINEFEKSVQEKKKQITNLNAINNENGSKIEKIESDYNKLKEELEFETKLREIYSKQFYHLFSNEHSVFWKKNIDEFPEIIDAYRSLINDNELDSFINAYNFVTQGGSIDENSLNMMIARGLLIRNENHSEFVTPLGTIIYRVFIKK